jgi:hypothetical protein
MGLICGEEQKARNEDRILVGWETFIWKTEDFKS